MNPSPMISGSMVIPMDGLIDVDGLTVLCLRNPGDGMILIVINFSRIHVVVGIHMAMSMAIDN